MNEQVIGVIHGELHPEARSFEPSGLRLAIEECKEWWLSFSNRQRMGMMAGAAVLVVLLLVGVTIVIRPAGTTAPMQKAQTEAKLAEAKPAAPLSVALMTPSSETLSLIQMEFDALREAANQNSDRIDAANTVINAHSVRIKSVEESLKDNPKLIQSYKDDIEKVRKVMNKPHVELKPFD